MSNSDQICSVICSTSVSRLILSLGAKVILLIAAAQVGWAMADQPKEKAKEQRKETAKEKWERAGTFIPKDNMPMLYGGPHSIAVVYMRRIEFFSVHPSVRVFAEREGEVPREVLMGGPYGRCGCRGLPKFMSEGKEVRLKPHKVLRFTYNISTMAERPAGEILYPCGYLLVASNMSNPLGVTMFSGKEEREMVRLRPHRKWKTPKGDFGEFYGMFKMDGTLVFRADTKAGMPDRWISNWHVSPDGGIAFLAIGRAVLDEESGFEEIGCVNRVIMWMSGRGVEEIPLEDAIRDYPSLKKVAMFDYWTRHRPGRLGEGCD